jgi:hypothetical protein
MALSGHIYNAGKYKCSTLPRLSNTYQFRNYSRIRLGKEFDLQKPERVPLCLATQKASNGQTHMCGENLGHPPPHRCSVSTACRFTWTTPEKTKVILSNLEQSDHAKTG